MCLSLKPTHVAVKAYYETLHQYGQLPYVCATSSICHPEAAESLATQATPNEVPIHFAGNTDAADKSVGPSARKKRGPQDDNRNSAVPPVSSVVKDVDVFRAFVKAGHCLAEIHVSLETVKVVTALPSLGLAE